MTYQATSPESMYIFDMMSTIRRDNSFSKYLVCKGKPSQFPVVLKTVTFDFAIWIIDNLQQNKKHCSNETEMLHYKKLVFRLCQGFSTYLSILNAFQNEFKSFLKYSKSIHARYEHFITHLQYQSHTNMNKIISNWLQVQDVEISSKV